MWASQSSRGRGEEMGRKNQIEGQLNFLDMLTGEVEKQKEVTMVQSEPVKQKKAAPGKFKECASCWCVTCEHSTIGGGVPRPFGEAMRACPSCELCVNEGKADVCVIGSAEEGCRYRAEKEGLVE